MRRVAIIGGGLAGLTVAWRRTRVGDPIVVFEGEKRLGGQLFTERAAGFAVEHGAEGYVAGSAAVAALANEVGVGSRVVEQLVHTSFGFDGEKLVALGPGEAAQFLGFQVPRGELGKGIRSMAGGMSELVEALARGLGGVEIRCGTPVERIERRGATLRVWALGEALEFDEVVVATSARAASALLSVEFGSPATRLAEATLHSSVTVSLAYARADVPHALNASGFVVAESAREFGLRACAFTSSKLPGRAPDGSALLRVFYRPDERELVHLPDAQYVERAHRSLQRILGVEGVAQRGWVSRWPSALPVFDEAHRTRVAELEAALAGSRVQLAGAAFHGAGIDAAVRSAFRAAETID